MKVMLAIGLAGAVGALLRYGCVRLLTEGISSLFERNE